MSSRHGTGDVNGHLMTSAFDPALEKSLLSLHAAIDVDSFWKAVRRIIGTAMPSCAIGLTLQHHPIIPTITRWTHLLDDVFFDAEPLESYLSANPRSKFMRASDVFPVQSELTKSSFYRQYMAPQKCMYLTGVFFWTGPRLARASISAISDGAASDSFIGA